MLAHKRRLAMAAAALIMVGGLAFARFSPAMAQSRQGVATWAASELPDGMHDVVFGLVGARAGVVISNGDGTMTEYIFNEAGSVEEAQAAATFPLKQPTTLPEGFALKSVLISEEGNWVNLNYEDGSGGILFFSETTVAQPHNASGAGEEEHSVVIHAEPGDAEGGTVDSHDAPAAGAVSLNSIHWESGGVYYELSGTFSEAELQAIADSVQ